MPPKILIYGSRANKVALDDVLSEVVASIYIHLFLNCYDEAVINLDI